MQKIKDTVTLPALMDQKTVAAYVGKSCAWFERARMMAEHPSAGTRYPGSCIDRQNTC